MIISGQQLRARQKGATETHITCWNERVYLIGPVLAWCVDWLGDCCCGYASMKLWPRCHRNVLFHGHARGWLLGSLISAIKQFCSSTDYWWLLVCPGPGASVHASWHFTNYRKRNTMDTSENLQLVVWLLLCLVCVTRCSGRSIVERPNLHGVSLKIGEYI